MEPLFLIVAGVIALSLIVFVGRNLMRMDRQERALHAPPPKHPDQQTPPPRYSGDTNRTIPLDVMEPPTRAIPVAFTAYTPREAVPDGWQPLLGYIHRQTASASVRTDALHQLGSRAGNFRESGSDAGQPVTEGALVTATPVLEGFQINPPTQTLGFFEEWQRFDFKIRPTTAAIGQAVNGRLTFSVEGVIIADVPLSIYVGATARHEAQHSTAKPYDAIFCSYSRRDIHIIERVERAYKILGIEYLRDMVTIRSGENWSDALQRMIERADIFQLFWSQTAADSKHVQMEWEYALSLPNKPGNFIRPVFWQQPMPPVPEALQHLHFAYDETLDD